MKNQSHSMFVVLALVAGGLAACDGAEQTGNSGPRASGTGGRSTTTAETGGHADSSSTLGKGGAVPATTTGGAAGVDSTGTAPGGSSSATGGRISANESAGNQSFGGIVAAVGGTTGSGGQVATISSSGGNVSTGVVTTLIGGAISAGSAGKAGGTSASVAGARAVGGGGFGGGTSTTTGGKVSTGGTPSAAGTTATSTSAITRVVTYEGIADVSIDFSPFGLDEAFYSLPVVVKVDKPLSLSLTSIVDLNPLCMRIEPDPVGSVSLAPDYGDFLFETSVKVGPSNPPGLFTDSQILRFWTVTASGDTATGKLTDQHKAPVTFSNYFYLPDVLTLTPVLRRISTGAKFTATSDAGTIYVEISGMIDQPIVDPNTFAVVMVQTPFTVDIEADEI